MVATGLSWLLAMAATWLTQRVCGPLTPPLDGAEDIKKRAT
jgi:phosphatidylglycerophosphatase B